MYTSAIVLVLVTLFSEISSDHFPSYLKRCKNDDNANACLKEAIQDALPKLKDGIKELNVAGLEPLVLPEVTIAAGSSAVHFSQNYKDFKIYNISSAIVTNVEAKIEDDNFSFVTEGMAEEIVFEALYEANGRILLFPIHGKGKCRFVLRNLKLHVEIDTEQFVKNDVKYLKVSRIKVKNELGKLELRLENLFDGNKALGEEINKVLNENWKDIYHDVQESYQELFEKVFEDYANKIFLKIPFNELIAH